MSIHDQSMTLSIDELRWLQASTDADGSIKTVSSSSFSTYLDQSDDIPLNAPNYYGRPLQPRYILTPPTPIPTPPPPDTPSSSRTKPKSAFFASSTSHKKPTLQTHMPPLPSYPSPPHRHLSPPPPLPEQIPSPEWIYRRPKSSHSRSATPSPTIRSDSEQEQEHKFWSSIMRPRSKANRSVPLLKTPDHTHRHDHQRSASDGARISPSSPSSYLSATSTSSPVKPKPAYKSHSSPIEQSSSSIHKPPNRPRSASSSSNPGKSIIRTSSVCTKASACSSAAKSVKFVEMPTIYHGKSVSECWDMDSAVDVTSCTRAKAAATAPSSPQKYSALKRFFPCMRSSAPERLAISGPFTLGCMPPPPLPALPSNASIRSGSSGMSGISGPFPLRSAPSIESFRSAKSAGGASLSSRSFKSMGGRSVRSVGSVGGRASKLKALLVRAGIGRMEF